MEDMADGRTRRQLMQRAPGELESINEELKKSILRRLPQPGEWRSGVAGLTLVRREDANRLHTFYTPFIGVTIQGVKHTVLGREEYHYGACHCFVTGVDMPSESYVSAASPEEPFLALSIDLNRTVIADLIAAMPPDPSPGDEKIGAAVEKISPKVLLAFLRFVTLLDEPDEIPIVAPILVREIHHRLLLGPQGGWLRSVCSLGTKSNHIARIISWLRDNFRAPLHVNELADMAHMSPSAFFRHFKQVTTLSPLQYQKTLRLYEARRLMLTQGLDATGAAYDVGYESTTQFIREYKRQFGEPPLRHITRLRAETTADGGAQ